MIDKLAASVIIIGLLLVIGIKIYLELTAIHPDPNYVPPPDIARNMIFINSESTPICVNSVEIKNNSEGRVPGNIYKDEIKIYWGGCNDTKYIRK